MTVSATSSTPSPPNSRQSRLREKAEQINLVLLEPDVDLWKLRELALSDGGLVNDTIRRRAWPKLVGLSSYDSNPDDIKVISLGSPARPTISSNKNVRKGTAPQRVTNFGHEENHSPGTAFTGGIFDQDDTAATAAQEDDNTSLASLEDSLEPSEVIACKDAEQIERDVTRCTWHLLTGGQRSRRRVMLNKHRKKISKILRRKQRRLGDLINLTLTMSENELPEADRLCYFQGYHDVASIFLSTLGGASTKAIEQHHNQPSIGSSTASTAAVQAASMGLELPAKVLYQVSLSHFREPMRADFWNLQTALRMVILPLLRRIDPELHAHLAGCGMEPFFALSWCLTMFSHDVRDTVLVKRLFDFFLVSHPLMPMYLSVAMLCHPSNRQEILATPCEFAELHNVLQGLPKNSSMVGWKWSVGVDGYVSDDEEVGEDGETSISFDSDMNSHQSGGKNSDLVPSLVSGTSDGNMRREDLILSEGHAQVVTMAAHVPFQELIDEAISIIGRVPPRKLRDIASRYYDEKQVEPMLELYPSITLFHHPPSWALAATAKADWVLKQRSRERKGMTSITSKDRRALSELRNRNNASIAADSKQDAPDKQKVVFMDEVTICTPEEVEEKAKLLNWPKAMVAQGFGLGEDEVVRINKRRKLLMIGGAATVAIFAVALGMAIQYHTASQTPLPQPNKTESGHENFYLDRDEAVEYIKSTRVPGTERKRRTVRHIEEPSSMLAATCPSDSVAHREGESLIQAYFQKYFVREFQIIYAKLRLLVATLGALNESIQDPDFTNHFHATFSQVAQAVASVQDPEVRASIHHTVTKRAVQAGQYVSRMTGKIFRFTASQARDNLGGDNFENLGLV